MLIRIITISLSMMLLTACGQFDASQTETNQKSQGTGYEKPNLSGTWKQDCAVQNSATSTNSTKVTNVYSAANSGTVNSTIELYYASSNCGSLSAVLEVTDAAFAISDQVSSPSGAWKIDTSILTGSTKVFVTVKVSGLALGLLNQSALCGISDWVTDQRREVTGMSCQGISITTGSVDHNLVKNSGSGTVAMGLRTSDQDGTTEAKRPTALDTVVFVKQ